MTPCDRSNFIIAHLVVRVKCYSVSHACVCVKNEPARTRKRHLVIEFPNMENIKRKTRNPRMYMGWVPRLSRV